MTAGEECIQAFDDWTIANDIDRVRSLSRWLCVVTGIVFTGWAAVLANVVVALAAWAHRADWLPPALVGAGCAVVTWGMFTMAAAVKEERDTLQAGLKRHFAQKRTINIHRFENGHTAVVRGVGNINLNGGRMTDRAIAQMAERAIREMNERGVL